MSKSNVYRIIYSIGNLWRIGYAETLRCAVLRGLQAISQSENDYGVGIEAGLMRYLGV